MIIKYFGIHYAHSSIKSIKSGSSEALHPPEKKWENSKASEETLLLEQKKKEDKVEGWRSQDQTLLKGHSSITHMHMTKF